MSAGVSDIELVIEAVATLSTALSSSRGKYVPAGSLQPRIRDLTRRYFESVRAAIKVSAGRSGLSDEIDFLMQKLLECALEEKTKLAYTKLLKQLKEFLMEANIDLLRAASTPRLVLSDTERAIHDTLTKMLPETARMYEQVLRDVAAGGRVSWRGTATELREALREVVDHLAPDDQVVAQPGFVLEDGLKKPTQKQKVRFILRARKKRSAAVEVAEASLETLEASIASLARSAYQRGSSSTHSATDSAEIRSMKRYVDALLAELLEIG